MRGKGWNTALDACNQKVRGERALKRKVVGKKKQEINSCTMKVEKKKRFGKGEGVIVR